MAVLSGFTNQISEADYWKAQETVIVGVSGGLDSIVLLDLLVDLPQEMKPAIHVAHVNHQLRPESDEEEAFVRKLCADYEVPCSVHTWNRSLQPDTGMEQAAREVRYAFFEKVAKKFNSSAILTAHHKDDQVETVLMRFVRGNSLDELTGIRQKRYSGGLTYIRPLLSFSKENLRDYALEKKLHWYEDETNQSDDYTRNRFRHTVLPLLREENAAVDEHIVSFAEEMSDVLSLLSPIIEEKLSQTMLLSEKEILIDRSAFLELDPILQKRVLEQAVKKWSANEAFLMKRIHSELLLKWLKTSSPNSSLDLPNNLVAVREYNTCRITYKKERCSDESKCRKDRQQFELSPDQWLRLPSNEVIGLLTREKYESIVDKEAAGILYLDLQADQLPLKIRHRKSGDRMTLKGMQGTRKIKDIFIDQKVLLKTRDKVWVVTDKTEEILWLIGHKESALSLDPITDTISYVLVYKDD